MNGDLDAIRRVLAADVGSFRRRVVRYQRPLLTLIRDLTPAGTDHEGVAQEVFLAAFRSLASFDPKRSAFSTWLDTIARNRCRNKLARRRPVVGAELPCIVNLRSPERAASESDRRTGDRRTGTARLSCPAARIEGQAPRGFFALLHEWSTLDARTTTGASQLAHHGGTAPDLQHRCYSSQFSNRSPGTFSKSRRFAVSKRSLLVSVIAAIFRSRVAIRTLAA
jgi:RNA polymerase sigma factor (sigma-70 family)